MLKGTAEAYVAEDTGKFALSWRMATWMVLMLHVDDADLDSQRYEVCAKL